MVWLYNILAAILNVIVIVSFKILCNDEALNSAAAGAVRNLAGLVIILPAIVWHIIKKPQEVVRNIPYKANFWLGLLGGGVMVLWPIVFINIESHIAMTFAFALPFVANIFFVIFFKEKIPLYVWVAKLFSLAGIMVILRPQLEHWTVYHTLGIACVFLWAISALLTKVTAQAKSPLSVSLYYYVIFGTIGTMLFSIPALKTVNYSFWLLFLLIGVVNTAGNVFMFLSFRYGASYLVQMMEFLKFIFILFIDITVFGSEIQNATILGAIIVLLSILVMFFLQQKEATLFQK